MFPADLPQFARNHRGVAFILHLRQLRKDWEPNENDRVVEDLPGCVDR